MRFLRVFVIIIFVMSLCLNLGCSQKEEPMTQDEPATTETMETTTPDATIEEVPADTTMTEEAPTEPTEGDN
ncbi:MAG: hypothetical protein ABIE07_12110 [Candidatus Zixiibacteriota bacterium]